MDDKTRNEITESISDGVSDVITTQLRNYKNKFNEGDIIAPFKTYDVMIDDDDKIEFNFHIRIKKIK